MIAIERPDLADELDDDALASLIGLEADLSTAEALVSPASQALNDLPLLRRRAVAAYRDALERAVGRYDDPRWTVLAGVVRAFLARVPDGASNREARSAVRRLHGLVAENL